MMGVYTMKTTRDKRKQRYKTLWDEQGGLCYFCDRPMRYRPSGYTHGKDGTLDHLIPRSKGGSNKMENLVLACCVCNNLKSNALVYKLKENACAEHLAGTRAE
jgi:5-methylcytosine-specific restriction endonuclease McrA